MAITWDEIQEGTALPRLEKRPGVTQLVKYAALGELVSNWLGHRGRIRKISCQFRGMDFPDQPIVCTGKVARKWEENGERLAQLTVWTENGEGKQTTPGEAVVVFTR